MQRKSYEWRQPFMEWAFRFMWLPPALRPHPHPHPQPTITTYYKT